MNSVLLCFQKAEITKTEKWNGEISKYIRNALVVKKSGKKE